MFNVYVVPGILQVAWLADSIQTRICMHCHDIYDHNVGFCLWDKEIHILCVDLRGTQGNSVPTTANYLVPLIKLRDDDKHMRVFSSIY